MTAEVHPLDDLSVLDQFAAVPFPPDQPVDRRTFYAPIDDVHGALVYVIESAQRSIVVAMYGFDDDELAGGDPVGAPRRRGLRPAHARQLAGRRRP